MVVEREAEYDCRVRIDGETFEVVSEFQYLGMIIDKNVGHRKKKKIAWFKEVRSAINTMEIKV